VSLPQANVTSFLDQRELEHHVRAMYSGVARDPRATPHFPTGRRLALELGYPEALLDAVPPEALRSFAGVGYHLDLAELRHGDRVLDLGSGSGTDAFGAATMVGETGLVIGVDFTDAQLGRATSVAARTGIRNVRFRQASIDDLPFGDGSFDVVISNGVVNLSPAKDRVFAEAARVLRPGGRLALSDIVTDVPLKATTRRNTELWAACIAGAVPATTYFDELVDAGFALTARRPNHYRFVGERAVAAAAKYGAESLTLAAIRQGDK
jgi:arsenite methyltransferase